MGKYPKTFITQCDDKILIRPASLDDIDNIHRFYTSLSDEVRHLLRYDLAVKEILESRLKEIDNKEHWRIIAMLGDKIIGDGTIDRHIYGWRKHVGNVRTIVDSEYYHRGIGSCIVLELINISQRSGIEILDCELLPSQTNTIKTLVRIGFEKVCERKDYIKDIDGKSKDLIFMSNNIVDTWNVLEHHIHELDLNYSATQAGMY